MKPMVWCYRGELRGTQMSRTLGVCQIPHQHPPNTHRILRAAHTMGHSTTTPAQAEVEVVVSSHTCGLTLCIQRASCRRHEG